jgi:hypothetical protein
MALDLVELERQIGIMPHLHTTAQRLQQRLQTDLDRYPEILSLVRLWLEKQGIPRSSAQNAKTSSCVLAYSNVNYLRAWRNKLNPKWAELQGIGKNNTSNNLNLGNMLKDDDEDENNNITDNNTANSGETAMSKADTEKWLKSLYEQIHKSVNDLVQQKLDNTTLKVDPEAQRQIRDLTKTVADQTARDVVAELMPPRIIEVKNIETNKTINVGLQHWKFPILLRAVSARDHRGFRLNVWLTGPTGSGKTSACEAVAKALDLPFGSDGSLDADYKVLGFRDANGNIVSTEFIRIYTNGGVYVADEIDNWMPSALLSLNAALANGWMTTPAGMVKRHENCCVIACANTWGLGATGDYVGRTRLDAASLDRFQPKIDWPYDESLERAVAYNMSGEIGTNWHDTIVNARAKAREQGLKIIISPRATFNGISLLDAGFDWQDVVDMTIAAGISAEQKKAIGLTIVPQAFNATTTTTTTNYDNIEAKIRRHLDNGEKIAAIRLYKEYYNAGLYEAKTAVEAMEAAQ